MTQLKSMEPGFQPTPVCAQYPDGSHSIRLSAEEETEAWEGRLQEPAWGRTLAFGDPEGR